MSRVQAELEKLNQVQPESAKANAAAGGTSAKRKLDMVTDADDDGPSKDNDDDGPSTPTETVSHT